MPRAQRKSSRPAPHSVYMLAEHLDAALAAGEDLAGIRCEWRAASPRAPEETDAARASERAAVERMRTFELALISRLLMAREWASAVALEDDRFAAVGRLYIAGTAPLVDAIAECADTTATDFDTGDDLTAYIRSRGLIATDAPALAEGAPIAADDRFLVARRAPLGALLDLVASFLDALEAEFDLFVELAGDDEPKPKPSAAAPAR